MTPYFRLREEESVTIHALSNTELKYAKSIVILPFNDTLINNNIIFDFDSNSNRNASPETNPKNRNLNDMLFDS